MDMGKRPDCVKKFHVFLSNTGSKTSFPSNKPYEFTHIFENPLSNMLEYEVSVSSFYLSSKGAAKSPVLHVSSDIVQRSLYDDHKLSILGIIPTTDTCWNPKPIYVPVCRNQISAMTVRITNEHGEIETQFSSDLLLCLSFRRIRKL